MSREIALRVEGLSVNYGRVRAVDHVSFGAGDKQRRVVCLLGTNGVGKTSTLRSILGLHHPSTGRIYLDGRDVTGLPANRLSTLGVKYVPEGRRVFKRLTTLENLRIGTFADGTQAWREDQRLRDVFDLFPELADLTNRPAGLLSGGEQQMLAIGRALMGRPRLLVLDEVSLGLAPVLVERIYERLARLRRYGCTILLTEQNVGAALGIADWAYIMESGRIVDEGPSQVIQASSRVKEIYLGG